MTEIHEFCAGINPCAFGVLHSILIPGCNELSFYGEFNLMCYEECVALFSEAELVRVKELLQTLGGAGQGDRVALVARFERDHPALFRRLYGDLLTAFYSAPETAARVQLLADSGPREPSLHFDPSLLDAVIRTQAGKRRL